MGRAPKPVIMVCSEHALGGDIFQLSHCASWEFDEVTARTQLICQLISRDKDFVLASETELADVTYQ